MISKSCFLALLLMMLILAAPAFGQEAVMEVDIDRIMSTYEDNELAGDQQFKGKRVKVSGVISRIAAEADGTPYVSFRTPSIDWGGMYCYFPQSATEALVKLKKGQKLAVTCTVKGKEPAFMLKLKDCVID